MIYTNKTCDFIITSGSFFLLTPLSDAARDWVKGNIGQNSEYQPFYPNIIIESRYVPDIVSGIEEDGLKIVHTHG